MKVIHVHVNIQLKESSTKMVILMHHKIGFNAPDLLVIKNYRFSKIYFLCVSHGQIAGGRVHLS